MAKRKTAAAATVKSPKPAEETEQPILAPEQVHALLGLPGPYEPPKPPPPWPGYLTFWDPGISIRDVQKKHPALFCRTTAEWVDGQAFAKLTDSWKWRQLKLIAAEPGQPFDEQTKKLSKGDELPLSRELVAYLVIHALSAGERPDIPRLRCRDVMPSGRRVCIGPFRDSGLEIANVSDPWSSPGIGLASIFTPPVKRK
ncbi:MAG TPA: hypothetical protein VD866_28480 [Urbifossiella sp.]|nr:hypothetical protein [Urbifossiella sp.]